jgi:hypothetical protein
MPETEDVVYCDGCGVEITWAAVVKGRRVYCCEDCLNGIPCDCGERLEIEDDRRGERE